MTAAEVLEFQLLGSCRLVADAAGAHTETWTARVSSGMSLPGFIVWHCARIIDWGVHTVVRGVPELGASPEWGARVRYDMGHGAGLTDAEADDIAATVRPEDVHAYALALQDLIAPWIHRATESELTAVPDLRGRNLFHPRYASQRAWEEIEGLEGVPAWQVLARPCISHIRMHMGELDVFSQLVQAPEAESA